jgi:Uma2 family endonuclease
MNLARTSEMALPLRRRLMTTLHGQTLGVVLTAVGFKLALSPDTVRAPDIAFVRQERIPSPDPRGFLTGPPDLAVEVLSPDDARFEVRAKVKEYLDRGVSLVVVVDPIEKSVSTHRRLSRLVTVRADDDLIDLGDVVPDFCCRLRDIFE